MNEILPMKFLCACAALTWWSISAPVRAEEGGVFLENAPGHVPCLSEEGRKLFKECECDAAFWRLAQFYAPQADGNSCGAASCIITLNALQIERPVSKAHGKFPLFTADNFFTPEVEAVVKREKVSASGMSLDQLGRALSTSPVKVQLRYASDVSLDVFRKELRESLERADRFIIVNYLRKVIGQQTGGHFSPIGAYHVERDMALIMDTANYKYPWTWVKLEDLWKAMAAPARKDSSRTRGYAVVSRPEGAKATP